MRKKIFWVDRKNIFTCKNVRPSSRNSRNGTSVSIGFRSSLHPVVVRYCDPDTAHIGAFTPEIKIK